MSEEDDYRSVERRIAEIAVKERSAPRTIKEGLMRDATRECITDEERQMYNMMMKTVMQAQEEEALAAARQLSAGEEFPSHWRKPDLQCRQCGKKASLAVKLSSCSQCFTAAYCGTYLYLCLKGERTRGRMMTDDVVR